ncbi:hypothetical protein CSKR_113111 [Clonorchis sinensis]|uniref:Uncharacterized protein n=1 Tax=Clonorchis sinensis TaxID=79923 RepID=A0A419Q9G5_CLOSI|nr:hypothetical protein CSKR_113111 [Clonorchis sinensis]
MLQDDAGWSDLGHAARWVGKLKSLLIIPVRSQTQRTSPYIATDINSGEQTNERAKPVVGCRRVFSNLMSSAYRYIHVSRYLEYRSNWNMRRPGAAHSVAWKHHKREIQLGSRLTETRGLRLPDEPELEGRNRSWAVGEFSATL